MTEKYSLALWNKTTGAALSGASVELRGGAFIFYGVEIGTSGRYKWSAIDRGRYTLFVNGDDTGETYAVGAGELAGIGYEDGKKLASTADAVEWVDDSEGTFTALQLDTTVSPAVAKGKIAWNEADGTFNMGLKNGVTLQVGEETLIYVHNETGADILNGRAVGLAIGSADGELHVSYVDNLTASAYDTIAVATQDIANGAHGYVTKTGKVHDINTASLTEGAFVYLSASNGQLTSIKPVFPAHVVQIGRCVISNAVTGIVYVDITVDLAMEDLYNVYPTNTTPAEGDTLVREGNRWINRNFGAITRDPTGFKNGGAVVVTYDSATRKVTLTGPVEAYFRASLVPALVTGWVSPAHPVAPTTAQFLYFDGISFVWSSVPWTYDLLQITAVVYNDLGVFQFGVHETHGTMAWQTHQEFHQVIGCYNRAGGDLSAYVLNSTTAANRRPDISTTLLADEDLETLNPLLASKLYTTYSLSGVGTSVSFGTGLADIIALSGNNPYYNLFSGGVWSQALMSNNDYAAIFVYAMPVTSDATSQGKRYFFVQPQASSNSQTTIDALSSADINLGGLNALNPEMNAIAKIVIRYTASNWQFISVSKLTSSRYGVSNPAGSWLSSVTTDTSLTGLGTVSSPLGLSGNIPHANVNLTAYNIAGSGGFTRIGTGTTDGADDKRLMLTGGGGSATNRGARIDLYGNEASVPGSVTVYCGDAVNSSMEFVTGLLTSAIVIGGALDSIQFKIAESHGRRSISVAGVTAATATDYFIVFTGTVAQSYTLPATGTTARQLVIKNRGTNLVTINRAGSDTIDGGTSIVLTTNQSVTLINNGIDWCII